MLILGDTNVLLRSIERGHRHQPLAVESIKGLQAKGHEIIVVPQFVYELWVVATRPIDQNGLGFAAERADGLIDEVLKLYPIFEDESGVFDLWRIAVRRARVLGKQAHDARLVAAMLRHGVTHLLTFNVADFARFTDISALDPHNAAAFPPAG
jgi:predicted nucleic acid-binding protein